MWNGTVVDTDTLALGPLREVGLFGSVLGHEGITVVVVLNSLRLLFGERTPKPAPPS